MLRPNDAIIFEQNKAGYSFLCNASTGTGLFPALLLGWAARGTSASHSPWMMLSLPTVSRGSEPIFWVDNNNAAALLLSMDERVVDLLGLD